MRDKVVELAVVSVAVCKMINMLEYEGGRRGKPVAGEKQRSPVALVIRVDDERLPCNRDDRCTERRPASTPGISVPRSGYRNGPANAHDHYMSKPKKSTELVEGEPTEPGYPRPDESKLEDLPTEWSGEDVEIENRAPNLGEMDEDPDEM
jgi:hypothetical protein